ncbi:uncharacterized protein [Triticum aestivum]|uniref:uncharacterized protein isoform X2 n=1 Tax=Triticum aestivum TaxID=4565 RepID=UPI001D00F15E|nr:uncharacterized protein LOC123082026 isoform X2 [Triticum aestivum]
MAFIAVLAAWKAPSSLHLCLGSTRQPQHANSRNRPKKLDPSSLLQWNRPEPKTPMVRGDGGAGETMNRRAHMGGRQIDGGAGSHARLWEAYNLSSTRVITMSHHRYGNLTALALERCFLLTVEQVWTDQGIARWTLPEQSSKLADFSRKRVTHRPHKQYEEPGKKYKLATKGLMVHHNI